MALKNFVKAGTYTKVVKLWMEPEKEILGFTLDVKSGKDQGSILGPIDYVVSKNFYERAEFEKLAPKDPQHKDFAKDMEKAKLDAKSNNKYVDFFSPEKIYVESNIVAQAYNYLKTLPAFEGVEDDV